MSSNLSRLVRHRMAETGEKYTAALRAIRADPAEKTRLRIAEQGMRARMRYPCTPRDGLDARHVLSAWETQRRKH